MRNEGTEHEVDPLALPIGTQVGTWRVTGFRGRGAYGTLYRVVRVGHEDAGPAALKLAIYPGDLRFARESWLLRHIRSEYVPQFLDEGTWEHATGAYPYVVMELVDGEPLYEWAWRRNPSEAQVVRVLWQVARAVADTHAAGALHRDVKGSNVLVRRADGRAFLVDFGAGDYQGSASLTSNLLPPGTPAYRSPEAWGFLRVFRRHPTVHYPASPCDDLFALGVLAYRLVTDEYPPSTSTTLEDARAGVWGEGGAGPQPPCELNPRVGRELSATIMRLLSQAPDERFGGRAEGAVEALAQVHGSAGGPLFTWGHAQIARGRSPEPVRRAEVQEDAVAREAAARHAEEPFRGTIRSASVGTSHRVSVWGTELAIAWAGLLFAALLAIGLSLESAGTWWGRSARAGGSTAVGESASAVSSLAPVHAAVSPNAVGLPMPDKPFPGQRTPPCTRHGEVLVSGGCWYELAHAPPPCKEDAYDWKGGCYLPSYPARRQPTAAPP